jgi:adenylosuccinate lyase
MHENILAERYASSPIKDLWSRENLIRLSRHFWIAVLKVTQEQETDPAQKAKIDDAIAAYTAVIDQIDIASIAAREKVSRHDQAAEIAEFNELANQGMIHSNMTSRDKSDNVEQMLHVDSLYIVRDRCVAVLAGLRERSLEFATLDICGRSHNTPAQTTTLGKRFANLAEELLIWFQKLEDHLEHYRFRGIKGPMGTKQDFRLDEHRLFLLMGEIRGDNTVRGTMDSVGQIYPRSLDFSTVSILVGIASVMSNFSNLIRLMAGQDFVHEGFGPTQIGSSAMPHKMNARTCERVRGLYGILKGHLTMIEHVAGDQWFEGDVSCSVVRRVVFPDAFFTIDGIFESVLTVMTEMEVFPQMIENELNRYQPFLATSALLAAAIAKGMDRQTAHEIIRRHAVLTVKTMRDGRIMGLKEFHPLVAALIRDRDFPLTPDEILAICFGKPNHGNAETQVYKVAQRIDWITEQYPQAALYEPDQIR